MGGNPGSLAAIEPVIANDPAGSTQIESIHWNRNGSYGLTNAAGDNRFAQAVPGSFGGDQNNYGVVLTGEIHIPNDADRNSVESIKFHDGCDDFCYLEIDGVPLIENNQWSNLAGTGNNGGTQATMDVSDVKYDDGEWVSFRMIFWEGSGGDDCIIVWDALDATGADSVTGGADATLTSYLGGADGAQVSFLHDLSDKIPSENFRALVPGLKLTVSGTGQPSAQLIDPLPAGTLSLELIVNGELCQTVPTIVSTSGANFPNSGEIVMTLDDAGQGGVADVDSSSLTATLDGAVITPAILKVGTVTTLTYTFPTPPVPNTNHLFEVTGTTTAGTGSVPFTLSASAQSFPFLDQLRAGLPAPPNATVGWDYMEFDVLTTLGVALGAGQQSFVDAQTVISTAGAPTAQADQPYVNHSDPDNNGGRGDWIPDLPILSDTAAVDENQFVTYARTTITIDPGFEGDYTFRVTGDDGFGLRVAGASFTNVYGQAQNQLHPIDTSVVYRPDYGGGGNTVAVCNFPASGDYLVEFFGFEGGGGAYQEISWTSGAVTDVDFTTSWVLLGDTSAFVSDGSAWGDLPEAILPPLPSGGDAGWSTYIYYNASVGSLNNTLNFLRNVADPVNATATILPELNHADDGGNAGRFNPSAAFPGDPNVGAGTDNIAMIARAKIVAPVAGDYTIQVRSDDGFLLRFTDPANAFSSLAGAGNLRAGAPSEVYFPNGTGDSNTRATVYLEEGAHEVVYVWWEGGGGAHFEISSAPGLVPLQTGPFELLSTTESLTNLYVAGSEPIELVISDVTYDKSNDNYSLTFNSEAGKSYTITADTDLNGFETEVDDNVSGTGADVTYGPFLSPFPGTGKVFFRVQEN